MEKHQNQRISAHVGLDGESHGVRVARLDVTRLTIDQRRRACGLSQADLAAVLGVSEKAAHDRLHGRVRWKLSELEKVADLFGVAVGELVVDSERVVIDGPKGSS